MTTIANNSLRCVQVLNSALTDILGNQPEVILIGEDLDDPYGGAFKVSKGLSTCFPGQVICTPISESAIFGVACGLSLRGFRPMVEVMFGDFLTLGLDQIINHISPFQDTCKQRTPMPLVVRVPMGGGRGYGPTHSKSLETLLLGVPNILVVVASQYHDLSAMLKVAVASDQPVFFIENKQMYAQFNERPVNGWLDMFQCREGQEQFPSITLSPVRFAPAMWTIATYGGSAPLAIKAARYLMLEHEVPCEVVIVGSLQPLDSTAVKESVHRTGALITLEEGVPIAGFGAELISKLMPSVWGKLREAPQRIGALPVSIPAAPSLEQHVLPNWGDVVDAVLSKPGRWSAFND
jgi:pyruvate/2-oxoglutarate/acetoin dehydrogenase E1 component